MSEPLPPLNALRTFEVIARHLSFAKAAEELHVTPATPGLVAKWLMPRLWRFLHAHPDVDARVSASMKLADFAAEGVDVAIRLSKGDHPDLHVERLFDDSVLPVCSPRLVEPGLRSAADL